MVSICRNSSIFVIFALQHMLIRYFNALHHFLMFELILVLPPRVNAHHCRAYAYEKPESCEVSTSVLHLHHHSVLCVLITIKITWLIEAKNACVNILLSLLLFFFVEIVKV